MMTVFKRKESASVIFMHIIYILQKAEFHITVDKMNTFSGVCLIVPKAIISGIIRIQITVSE